MVIRIAGNFLWVVVAAGRCLAIQSGKGVAIIVCVLEIIVYLNVVVIVPPIASYRNARSCIRQQFIGYTEDF